MLHNQFLVKKINGGLRNVKWDKLGAKTAQLKLWGLGNVKGDKLGAKIVQLKLGELKSNNCKA
jgi:hypothetical protein